MIAASLLMVSLWLPKNSNASTAQVPYYLRELKDQKDIGAVNENFRNLSDYMTKLGETVDADSGGNAKLESDQTWTGTNQFSTVTFSITPSSTTTLPLNQTTVFSAGFVCIATVTYSAQGSMVGVFLNGGDGIASSGYEIYFWVLVDGSIPSPYGVTRAMVQNTVEHMAVGISVLSL